MKQLIGFILTACLITTSTRANFYSPITMKSEATVSSLPELLNLYYEVKNALFNSNAGEASSKAALLVTAINGIDMTSLSEKDHTTFMSLKDKLTYDARHIADVQKLDHQREHFASLSLNMYLLAKTVSMSKQPVYEDYCPMKKMYWLSSEAAIKNPYFGEQMPDCGEIKHTLP